MLHEAGVPPLHTTFKELDKFPARVKKRMYVVHSSNIPEEFDLRKAPTGTAGTLRLDELKKGGREMERMGLSTYVNNDSTAARNNSIVRFEDDEVNSSWESPGSEYVDGELNNSSISDAEAMGRNSIVLPGKKSSIPLVSMRPTSNTDSWYMLNLLQAVPFLTRYVLHCVVKMKVNTFDYLPFYIIFSFKFTLHIYDGSIGVNQS